MKLILNLHLGTIGLAFSEAFVLSQKLGFEPRVFVDAFNKTVQKNYFSEVKGPLIAKGDYAPLFTVNMLLKDLTLAEDQATRQKVALPAGSLVKQLFMTCVNQGRGRDGFQLDRTDDAEAEWNRAILARISTTLTERETCCRKSGR